MTRKDYLYQHYTWPELGQAAKRQPVVVLPIGSVEDHGPHLPLDVDNFLIWSICEAAAQQAEGARRPTATLGSAQAELERARELDRSGKEAECMAAIYEARRLAR